MKILITGASKGIGLFLLNKFYSEGYDVFGTYSSTIPPNISLSLFTKVDITNLDEVHSWINNTVNFDDNIVLVNCASINYNTLARKADVEKWKHLIDVNLVGTFGVINSVLPIMYERGYGRIINLSSVIAQKGIPGTSAYAASKSALIGMAKAIAVENANKNITINNLNLGYYNIGMTISDVPEKIRENILTQIPNGQLGNPENIYNAIQFLIKSEYVNGASIDLNGGLI